MSRQLLFLPIDISLDVSSLFDHKETLTTFKGLWSTMILKNEHIESKFIKNITDQLPFTKLMQVKYNIQKTDVISHIDVRPEYLNDETQYQNILECEPSGYRIVLLGRKDSIEVLINDQWIAAPLPTIPCAYLINSTSLYHRIYNDTDRRSLYFRGLINNDKHQKLIQDSLKKFKQYAIYSS